MILFYKLNICRNERLLDFGFSIYLYVKRQYFNKENIETKKVYILSLILIISEMFIFDINNFNEHLNSEIVNISKEKQSLFFECKEDEMLKFVLNKIKAFNDFNNFEELNFKKEFIKSKFQHDANLFYLKKIYFSKNEEKEKVFSEIMKNQESRIKKYNSNHFLKKPFSLNNKDSESNIDNSLFIITNHFLDLYEELLKTNSHEMNIFDERIFIKNYIVNFIELEKITKDENNCFLNNDANYNFTQSPLINQTSINQQGELKNDNNFIFKTDVSKINPLLNQKFMNNKALFKNDNFEYSNNESKQSSFKTLKFDGGQETPLDSKENKPMSLSANIKINDWLNNLIKNNEKKYNYKPKEDVFQYLKEEEQV